MEAIVMDADGRFWLQVDGELRPLPKPSSRLRIHHAPEREHAVTKSAPAGPAQPTLRAAFNALGRRPPSAAEECRKLAERHKREGAEIRAALRRPSRRPAWRPPVLHASPTSSPRPREGGARMVAASGRDGTGERDDGSGGDSDGGGGGSSEPSGPRSHAPFAGGVR